MTEPLYESPIGLYPPQADGVALGYLRPNNLFEWDTGTGKSHVAMATAALLFEDDLIDHVLLVCKRNKLGEWLDDLQTFTKLTTCRYHGDINRRRKLAADPAQVFVTTYETARADSVDTVVVKNARGRNVSRLVAGFLSRALQGKRTLVIYDEISDKLSNRSSGIYKSQHLLVEDLRKAGETRTMGLTATPMKRDPEGFFNVGRILTPWTMGTVAQFEKEHVVYRTPWHSIGKACNLTPEECDVGVVSLQEKMAPIVSRLSKDDPTVAKYFPTMVEEWTYVSMSAQQEKFYREVEKSFPDEGDEAALFIVLRQIANHPLALALSHGKLATKITAEVGVTGLKALGSAKADEMVERLEPLVRGQGAQVVVFTFFGQSVLPLLAERLELEGYKVTRHHGGLTSNQQDAARYEFRSGQTDIFLTSDAGADGINLPEAQYVFNFEAPPTHSNYIQRINRIHRIDSKHHTTFARTFVLDGTVDTGIVELAHRRNEWSDKLLGDEDAGEGLTAAQRKAARNLAKTRLRSKSNKEK